MVAARTAAIYVLMLAMIRLMGKRTIGNLTAFDMLIVLLMGDLGGNAIYGSVPMRDAVAAIASLAALHYGNSWLAFKQPALGRLVEGTPTVIVRDGQLQQPGLRRERMSDEEVRAELRLQGIEDMGDVRVALVENDGQVSVIRQPWAEPLTRGDAQGPA